MRNNRDIEFVRTYYIETENSTKVELKIVAEIKDLSKSDLIKILHEVATSSRCFYLDLGNEINSKLL